MGGSIPFGIGLGSSSFHVRTDMDTIHVKHATHQVDVDRFLIRREAISAGHPPRPELVDIGHLGNSKRFYRYRR